MPSIDENDESKSRQTTPSAPRNPPRCPKCGELTKGHQFKQEMCDRVAALKETMLTVGIQSTRSSKLGAAPTIGEGASTPSISNAEQRSTLVHRTLPNQLSSIPEYEYGHGNAYNNDASIVLRTRGCPALETQHSLILEMKTLLQLKSLHLSHFHINERGDWAFVVSGGREVMGDWVEETRLTVTTRIRLKPLRSCSATALALILGITFGLIAAAWALPPLDK